MRAAYHSSAGPGAPASSFLMHSSRRVSNQQRRYRFPHNRGNFQIYYFSITFLGLQTTYRSFFAVYYWYRNVQQSNKHFFIQVPTYYNKTIAKYLIKGNIRKVVVYLITQLEILSLKFCCNLNIFGIVFETLTRPAYLFIFVNQPIKVSFSVSLHSLPLG